MTYDDIRNVSNASHSGLAWELPTNRKTLWLRELRSFQSVVAVLRLLSPRSMTSLIPLRLVTTSSRRFTIPASVIVGGTAAADECASKSYTVSL